MATAAIAPARTSCPSASASIESATSRPTIRSLCPLLTTLTANKGCRPSQTRLRGSRVRRQSYARTAVSAPAAES
jgi:hypothetical protein